MTDQSFLDDKYFVDNKVYNCPFCNRRHVAYSVQAALTFDWTPEKPCNMYIVICHSCNNRSLHLSYHNLVYYDHYTRLHFNSNIADQLDDMMFYSVPTSFFILDTRIPKKLRELLTEAEGCLKSNFLTGASACARKIVYELARIKGMMNGNYHDRIKSLKDKSPNVDGTYFDSLLTIQKTTSSKVHENAYDGWEAKHVRLILSALREILHELYVVPALREDRRQGILELQKELLGGNAATAEGSLEGETNKT